MGCVERGILTTFTKMNSTQMETEIAASANAIIGRGARGLAVEASGVAPRPPGRYQGSQGRGRVVVISNLLKKN